MMLTGLEKQAMRLLSLSLSLSLGLGRPRRWERRQKIDDEGMEQPRLKLLPLRQQPAGGPCPPQRIP